MTVLFFHGVPDTPAVWEPLIDALKLKAGTFLTPALPGFAERAPQGFSGTKEAYLEWMLAEIDAAATDGPIDIIAHDWGAILALKAMSLRRDKIRSWVVSGAVIEPNYHWHRMARLWQTPIIGELVIAITPRRAIAKTMIEQGLSKDLALHEAKAWNSDMKQMILSLYRSARTVATDWVFEKDMLPPGGLVIWGEQDPYIPLKSAILFSKTHEVPLHTITNIGHWALMSQLKRVSVAILHHWAAATP